MSESLAGPRRKARIALSEAGLSLSEAAPLVHEPRGRAHDVFRVRADGGEFYVKVAGSVRPRFVNEAAALKLAAGKGLLAPELVHATDDVIITRRLGDRTRPLSDGDLEAWEELGAWLRALHELDPAGAGLRYDTDPLPIGERLAKSAERALAQIDLDLHLGVGQSDEMVARLRGLDEPQRFVHRDLRRDNILVGVDGDFLGVVDFEHAACAPTAWDFVKLLGWNGANAPARDALSSGYGELPDASLFAWLEAVTVLAHMGQRREYAAWARDIVGDASE